MKTRSIPPFATAAVLVLAGCGPRNYDECILKAMAGVESDMAARAIISSCRDKFPEPEPQDSALPNEALQHLTGHGGMGSGSFRGNIYNGNRDWTVTQITIMIGPKGDDGIVDPFDPNTVEKEYNKNLAVPPLTSQDLYFSVDGNSKDVTWNIIRARGYQSR